MQKELQGINNHLADLRDRRKELECVRIKRHRDSEAARRAANNLQRHIGFENRQDLEERISEIRCHLSSTSLTTKEEKRLLQEIVKLRQRCPLLAKLKEMRKLVGDLSQDNDTSGRINSINKEELRCLKGRSETEKNSGNVLNKTASLIPSL